MDINGYKLIETCGACPEQYDVFDAEGEQVGYLRLRHGYFACYVPDASGPIIYDANPVGDGIFESDERMRYLTEAVQAIQFARSRGDRVISDREQYLTIDEKRDDNGYI